MNVIIKFIIQSRKRNYSRNSCLRFRKIHFHCCINKRMWDIVIICDTKNKIALSAGDAIRKKNNPLPGGLGGGRVRPLAYPDSQLSANRPHLFSVSEVWITTGGTNELWKLKPDSRTVIYPSERVFPRLVRKHSLNGLKTFAVGSIPLERTNKWGLPRVDGVTGGGGGPWVVVQGCRGHKPSLSPSPVVWAKIN